MIVNGGTLTNACDDRMWTGIVVLGNSDKPQYPEYQGSVTLKNAAVVEHALCAISAAPDNAGGGIITATDASFRNNLQAIEYSPYVNYYPDTEMIYDNEGKFTRCDFVVDNNNLFSANGKTFSQHIKMNDVRGIEFIGCMFDNETGASGFEAGKGILSIDAGFKIDPFCKQSASGTPGQSGNDCECPRAKRTATQFQNLEYGISAGNSGAPRQIHIDQAMFNFNFIAVNIGSSDNYRLTRTDFSNIRYCGLQCSNSSGYRIEENTFQSYSRMYTGVTGTTGIEMHNSGAADNRIYKNDFNKMYVAISAQGNNSNSSTNCSGSKDVYKPPISETIPCGLQFICNNFDFNNFDLGIEAYSAVRKVQGSPAKGADNKFSRTIDSDLYIGNTQAITYYHDSLDVTRVPTKAHLNSCSTINDNAIANDCASTFCTSTFGGGGFETKSAGESNIEKYKIMQEEYDLLAAEYEKNEYGYVLANPDEYPKEVVAAAME